MSMKRSYGALLPVLVAVALSGFAVSGWAQTPVPAQTAQTSGDPSAGEGPRPEIRFASLEHDFGQAISGESLKTTFTFTNVGDAVLVIEKVKGG